MRILFMAGSLNQGGAEFQILALAKLFKEKGHEVEVFALTDYPFYKYYVVEHRIPYSHLLNSQSKLQRLWLTAKKIREYKPDVIIAYLKIVGQMAIFSRILSFNSNVKLIIGERTSLILPRYDQYYFNLLRAADGITVNSLSKYRYIVSKFPFLRKKTCFTPNVMDLGRFTVEEKKFNRDVLNIIYVGRISPEKNVLSLVKAFISLNSKYSNLILKLYGDFRNASYLKRVKDEIAASGLANICLLGKSHDIIEVYDDADLLCLVSDFEGFSNVISEALCCGIPVVASNIDENRFLIEDGQNGFLVEQKSIESIAQGIEKFINLDHQSKLKISKNNRLKAESLFDSDKLYLKYLSILQNS